MADCKSSLVGESCNLKDEIEKLPEELRKLWIDKKFTTFLDKFKDIISTDVPQYSIHPVLPFLSELGNSSDDEVHERIHKCYKELSKICNGLESLSGELSRSVASSSNKYLKNILCSERKRFCTDDFMKQHLTFISDKWEEQTFKVEEEMRLEFQKQKEAHPRCNTHQ